jgi:hypothetical protein
MEEQTLHDIHWHDSLILSVHLVPERDLVEMRLLLPEFARQKSFAEETVVFYEAHGYKEFEGPIAGSPSVLSASIIEKRNQWRLVKLETNAGHRELWCQDVYYQQRKAGRNA